MSSNKNSGKTFQYKNLTLTNHAKGRVINRSLSLENLFQTVQSADNEIMLNDGRVKFIKSINNRTYQVVAKYLTDEEQWLIISAWVRGEDDKVPFVWQLITLPFKLIWKLLCVIFNLINSQLS